MKDRIIYYAVKYDGNYDKIHKAIMGDESFDKINYLGKYITLVDKEYPSELFSLKKPPYVLFYKGDIRILKSEKIGIIGSRKASDYGIKWTKRLVKTMSTKTIVSGMATGIDTVAHKSAIHFQSKTIAVLGSGINYVYPYINTDLYNYLCKYHLVISEFPYNTKPQRHFFPFRNRIIAALSASLYVMEAGVRSGTLLTVNEALELNKDIYVLPHRIDDESGLGCNLLIQQGASVIMIEDM